MSLTQEQIDAFAIAIEQEIEENPDRGSEWIEKVRDMLDGLSAEEAQASMISIAADLCALFSGTVLQGKDEREQRERDRTRAEEEASEKRREERRAVRRPLARENNVFSYANLTSPPPIETRCFCGEPNCSFARIEQEIALNLTGYYTSATYNGL